MWEEDEKNTGRMRTRRGEGKKERQRLERFMSRVADTASALVVGVSYGTPPHPPGLLYHSMLILFAGLREMSSFEWVAISFEHTLAPKS